MGIAEAPIQNLSADCRLGFDLACSAAMPATDGSAGDRLPLALTPSLFGNRLALDGNGFGHAVVSDAMGFEQPFVILPDQLLAALIDVIPASAAADAEEMTDRDCHVAAAVNGKVPARAVLRDQRSDEPLITAMDGTVAEVAHNANRCRRRLRILKDWSAPVVAEEDRHGSTTP
jgi:hypothetical protein